MTQGSPRATENAGGPKAGGPTGFARGGRGARSADTPFSTQRATWTKLGGLLLLGLILRIAFLSNEGFKNDIAAFEAWALSLASMPFSNFYAKAGFADYPPGYFYILGFLGRVYALFHVNDPGWTILRTVVKLPAVVMDLADGVVMFALVRRFFSERWAYVATALFVLNPAVIFISAAWGQVDSIAGGLALLSVYLLLTSDDDESSPVAWRIVWAWVSIAYALLIKPQPAILVPLMLAFTFTGRARLVRRLTATGIGIAGGLLLALIVVLPFHPTANPLDAFSWLYEKYAFGKSVYPYNSINAFNLWTIKWKFWETDTQPLFLFSQATWGVILLLAATVLILVRYVQSRTPQAFLEAAALLTLAFFMLATRMHERYIFDGLLFTIACAPVARRYVFATVLFSITLLVNLWYSWQYILVMFTHVPVADPRDMYPWITHPLSLLNVVAFFVLGFIFLGQGDEAAITPAVPAEMPAVHTRAREWFDPREGLAWLVWPLDYIVAGAIGVFSFVLSFVNYWKPGEKIFDEIYFARAAEEYLTHKYIYESTHPPLTKLIITVSQMLFGGLQNGHATAVGSRFLDVVFGAIAVVVLYAFAKRLTRSTFFSAIAALLLTFDGMHFVQSRIATPEGIVVVFSLGALYAFYRYWLAAQSVERSNETKARPQRVLVSAVVALIAGFVLSALINVPAHQTAAALVVAAFYFALGFYLLMRLVVMPRFFPTEERYISYPDGSLGIRRPTGIMMHPFDGRTMESSGRKGSPVTLGAAEATVTYRRDGTVAYDTPAGGVTYAPATITVDDAVAQDGRHRGLWLVAFTVLLGMLVSSKWYGVMAYPVSFMTIAFVWTQRYWRHGKLKLWGNPTGFRLDVAFVSILFLSLTVYGAVWIPDAIRHIYGEVQSLSGLVQRQYDMFHYHDTLVATHPYQSSWWQWPLDLRPIAYYFKDTTGVPFGSNPAKCCVAEILSLPNPFIMWFGLLCVPFVGYLAWFERNKGYGLLALAYLLQWLPWIRSPRITFAYHFYVNIPIIILCNVIVLQRLWNWPAKEESARLTARAGVVAYVVAVAAVFAWFYPILAGVPIAQGAWNARMWHWLVGNGWI